MSGLYLSASSLTSKWGFHDGDTPDEYLDWLEDHGFPYPQDWHGTLRILVREWLMPLLADHEIELVDIQTIHNPIRAARIDGQEVDHYNLDAEPLGDVAVVVPFGDVYEAQMRSDR